MSDRRLHWPACRNARDLGGLRTTDGGQIRAGALIRTDDLSRLTADGVAALRSYGVRRIIDLRSGDEMIRTPGPFADDPIYFRAPLIDEQAERHRDPVKEVTLAATYRGSIERNGRTIAAGILALACAPQGGVVVHCAAGKDRTGIHVALALRVADVRLDEIAADYALTREYLREYVEIEPGRAIEELVTRSPQELRSSRPETILGMLEYVETSYGSVAHYLRRNDISPDQIAALRARLRATE